VKHAHAIGACLLALASLGFARPTPCRDVPAGAPLQVLLDSASDGDAFCLAPGDHPGPLRVTRRVTIAGPREAVVRATGAGSTIALDAAGAALVGISVDGSGGRFETLDAAVRIAADESSRHRINGALFGISRIGRAGS
jgi:nitrous oxidase accessory protein